MPRNTLGLILGCYKKNMQKARLNNDNKPKSNFLNAHC